MLTAAERSILRRKLEQYEGRFDHMYLDTDGNVTVGVGHLLATVDEAKRLAFVTAANGKATAQQIAEDYAHVAAQAKGQYAGKYKPFCKLSLPNAEIDRVTEKHIDSFHRELRVLYPRFDRFPSPARLALFDMIFNMGATRLRSKYPKMNRAISEDDWAEAAIESNRVFPIAPVRNAYVRGLFQSAAKSVELVP